MRESGKRVREREWEKRERKEREWEKREREHERER